MRKSLKYTNFEHIGIRQMQVDPSIFKAYDIRGIVDKNLTEEVVELIGVVFANMAREQGADSAAVGRDGRLSGPRLQQALVRGLTKGGLNVVEAGMIPTPALYFAAGEYAGGTGIAITGSHNPPEYNGLKMMIAGVTLYKEKILDIFRRISEGEYSLYEVPGKVEEREVLSAYIERISNGVHLERRCRVVVDAGNGVAGPTARELFSRHNVEADFMFCDVDGTFPNHHPDPSKPVNLRMLVDRVKETGADFGVAFDGDGDRLGVVTREGANVYPDRIMMLLAKDILAENPGAPIIYDVKCTRRIVDWIKECGGQPVISATGHSLVKAMMRRTKAPFAGEMSGHLFFNDERGLGFDDGIYAGLRVMEILSRAEDPSAVLDALPTAFNTPEVQIPVPEGMNHECVAALQNGAKFASAQRVIDVDGIRVEWSDGFALARASNTTPVLVMRFEGDTPEALERVRGEFIAEASRVLPSLDLSAAFKQD